MTAEGAEQRAAKRWMAASAAVAAVWLLLVASLPILAMPRAALDDALFVRQAA